MLDIFYNDIIFEAAKGKIECGDYFAIAFNTLIPEIDIDIKSSVTNNNILIPTLYIKDKKNFDDLLIQYVSIAIKFYGLKDDFNASLDEQRNKYKKIMALLWSNATVEDFQNPTIFLKNRISFFENKLCSFDGGSTLGYSEILKSNIRVENLKKTFYHETPFCLRITLEYENFKYYLPLIYYGINNEEVYIYAIQNEKKANSENNKYQKTIRRALYKVNEGFDSFEDNFEKYEEGNLKDITPSFLLALNIALGIFHDMGISKIIVPSILITRWNAKELSYEYKRQILIKEIKEAANANKAESLIKDINDSIDKEIRKHETIQYNLTEKFIRTFLRLVHQIDGLDILNISSEIDNNLILYMNSKININNPLLKETFISNKKNNKQL